ncbi:MAG: 50S ribosomal protein L32 [Actinobacteria bacterium]|nr:50S ribosomal protein L32 [Actinomycetota bacterium]
MSVPKRKMSRSNTLSRRAKWKASAVGLIDVTYRGRVYQVPARLRKAVEGGYIEIESIPPKES